MVKQASSQKSMAKRQPWWVSVIIIVLVVIFAPDLLIQQDEGSQLDESTVQTVYDNFDGENFENLPKLQKIPVDYLSARDGDTIKVRIGKHTVNVRYLMIDTKEMHYDTNQPEPYALEAKKANEQYLEAAQQVYVELDVGPATDNYQRLLAYVYADDLLLNQVLVQEGYATVRYVNPPNNSYESLLRQAEVTAQQQGINLWQD